MPWAVCLAGLAALLGHARSIWLNFAGGKSVATGLGRSLAIEILEFFDTLGVTQRLGDMRKMRKDFVPILGAAAAPARPPAAAKPQQTNIKSPHAQGRPFSHGKR